MTLSISRHRRNRQPSLRTACVLAALPFSAAVMFWGTGRLHAADALVKVTPLGSHSGELCSADRALLFEDPTGVRILYDPGNTTDESDPRLGEVNVMLLSHAHGDHLGNTRPNRSSAGTCAAPANAGANANSNFATIAAIKNAAVIAFDTNGLVGSRIQAARGGAATPGCNSAGLELETIIPVASPCLAVLNPLSGGRTFRRPGTAGVRIFGVPALHPNSAPAPFVDAPGLPPGVLGFVGAAGGYVVRFSNGLTAYLTGDTGLFGDMQIIGRFHRPNLVVLNLGDAFSLGVDEAVFAIRELVRPTTVMPSHVNEAATSGGAIRAITRTEDFARRSRAFADVVLPLSDVTLTFDGGGRCIGCAVIR